MNGCHDVSIAIHELEKLFQAPEKAAAAAHDCLCQFVVVFLQLPVDVFKYQSNDSADCDDERSKSKRADMEAEGSVDGVGEGEEWNVILAQCPVPTSECPSKNHFRKR